MRYLWDELTFTGSLVPWSLLLVMAGGVIMSVLVLRGSRSVAYFFSVPAIIGIMALVQRLNQFVEILAMSGIWTLAPAVGLFKAALLPVLAGAGWGLLLSVLYAIVQLRRPPDKIKR
jgi:hypothetical protein